MDIQRINPSARWSDATIFNGTAYFVEIAADATQAIESQVTQILSQAEQTLLSVGSNTSSLLSVTIYVTDINYLAVLNPIWENWLPKNCAPSRACIKAELANPALLVEMAFVAAVCKPS